MFDAFLKFKGVGKLDKNGAFLAETLESHFVSKKVLIYWLVLPVEPRTKNDTFCFHTLYNWASTLSHAYSTILLRKNLCSKSKTSGLLAR